MTGIVSYGFYIPRFRVKVSEIASIWKKKPEDIEAALNIKEKAVGGPDEDALTMAYESASMAVSSGINPAKIGAVFVGSESHPYAVNPTSTILAEFLGIPNTYLAFDTQFACKAATGAMIAGVSLVKSGYTDYALITAADKATGRPHDPLEYTAASGSASFILGNKNVILEVVDCASYSSDTPDFWRRDGMRYPSHGGRFTGTPAYFHHVRSASELLLKRNKMSAQDFDYGVFHMPNGKFPLQAAASLGFTKEQVLPSLSVTRLGNSYTASALTGLVQILDTAKAGDRIFFASYGSGAGSDVFIFQVTKHLESVRKNFKSVYADPIYIDYSTYLKFMGVI